MHRSRSPFRLRLFPIGLAVLLSGITSPAGATSIVAEASRAAQHRTSEATRVLDRARDVLEPGGLAAAVRAAASLIHAPVQAAASPPVAVAGLLAALAEPVGSLLGAILCLVPMTLSERRDGPSLATDRLLALKALRVALAR